uniref:KN motif and ankyrin repeat domain-containing protein 1-like isoform X2 n=1 Tax=Myxine glutinosa TaxID=7769 RepID=UPI00358FB5C2
MAHANTLLPEADVDYSSNLTPHQTDSYHVDTPYGYQLDLDFVKLVDDIEKGLTVHCTSSAYHSPCSSYQGSPFAQEKEPMDHGSRGPGVVRASSRTNRHLASGRNYRVEKTLIETRRRLELERQAMHQSNVVTSNVFSPRITTRKTTDQSHFSDTHVNVTKETRPCITSGVPPNAPSASHIEISSQTSPGGSDLFTPLGCFSPVQLQAIRSRMAAGLHRLRELEELVKELPILQVKIAVMQEEKRQLVAQVETGRHLGGMRQHSFSMSQVERSGKDVELECSSEANPSNVDDKSKNEFSALDKDDKVFGSTLDNDVKDNHHNNVHTNVVTPLVHPQTIAVDVDEEDSSMGLETKMVTCELAYQCSLLETRLAEVQQALSMAQLREQILAAEKIDKGVSAYPLTSEAGVQVVGMAECKCFGKSFSEVANSSVEKDLPWIQRAEECHVSLRHTSKNEINAAMSKKTESPKSLTERGTNTPFFICLDTGTEVKPEMRTVAVGDGHVRDVGLLGRSRSVGVGTADREGATLRDQAVGDFSSTGTALVGLRTRAVACNTIVTGIDSSNRHNGAVTAERPLLQATYLSNSNDRVEMEDFNACIFSPINYSPRNCSGVQSSSPVDDPAAVEFFPKAKGVMNLAEDPVIPEEDGKGCEECFSELSVVADVAAGEFDDAAQDVISTSQQFSSSVLAAGKEESELHKKIASAALVLVKNHEGDFTEERAALASLHSEWFGITGQPRARPHDVATMLGAARQISPLLLARLVNQVDASGNTALHYSVSYANFPIVGLLLDTGVCNVDQSNHAGYTALMLASLAAPTRNDDLAIVQRIFSLGSVNTKSSQLHTQQKLQNHVPCCSGIEHSKLL